MPAIELGIEEFNTQSRKLMELINNLRDLGAHFDLEIPGIIVCGNQSAGKSSVIEGITKVPLPRADGTCTGNLFKNRNSTTEMSDKKPSTFSIRWFAYRCVEIYELGRVVLVPVLLTCTSTKSTIPDT